MAQQFTQAVEVLNSTSTATGILDPNTLPGAGSHRAATLRNGDGKDTVIKAATRQRLAEGQGALDLG